MTVIKAKKGIKYVAFWQCPCGHDNSTDIDAGGEQSGQCEVCRSCHHLDVEEPKIITGTPEAIWGYCNRCGLKALYVGDTCQRDDHHLDGAKCGGNVQLLPVMD